MKSPKLYGFDFDGVIFDIGPVVAEEATKFLGREISVNDLNKHEMSECLNISEEQVRTIINSCWEDKWFQHDYFISGALDGLNLIKENDYPIIIITARPHPERVKEYLLQRIDIDPIMLKVFYTHSKDKGPMARDLNLTTFIDDHFAPLDSVYEYGVRPILFNAPWNQHEHIRKYHRVNDWEELSEMINLEFTNEEEE